MSGIIPERVSRLMQQEKLKGPERVLNTPAVRHATGSGIRWAFCKTAAGSGSSLTCYLDTDGTGAEVTVYFWLLNCSNLSDGYLSLADGTPIPVMRRGGSWWCIIPIEGIVEKDCDE